MRLIKETNYRGLLLTSVFSMLVMGLVASGPALAASASEIDHKVTDVLKRLYDTTPGSKILGDKAKGILVFPKIVKAGFLIGGHMGDGALLKQGKTVAYYRSIAASFGLQAGLQAFDYVLMFMDDASLEYMDKSRGWELGTGTSLVVLDKGVAGSLSSTTLRKGVYAFIFDQKGVMAGIGLEGTNIIKITPAP